MQQPACGKVCVETPLFHGRPNQQPAIPARHEINTFRCPQNMLQNRIVRIHLQRHHLAFQRTNRRTDVVRQAVNLARPGAGRQHNRVCIH